MNLLSKHLQSLPKSELERVQYLLTDIDQVLTQYPEASVLDFGAGTGCMSAVALMLQYPKIRCTLVDVADRTSISPDIVGAIQGRHTNVTWENVQQLQGQQFNLVISTDVFEHIPNWRSAFTCTAEYVAYGGFFYIQTPSNYPSPNWPLWGIVKNRIKGVVGLHNPALHVRHGLSCKHILDHAVQLGFQPLIAAEDYVIKNTLHCAFKPRTHCLFHRAK